MCRFFSENLFQSKNVNRIESELNKSDDDLKLNLSNKTLGQCCHLSPISGGVLQPFFAGFNPTEQHWTVVVQLLSKQNKKKYIQHKLPGYQICCTCIFNYRRHLYDLISRLILLSMIKLPILRYHFIISFVFKERESEIMLTGINYMVILL